MTQRQLDGVNGCFEDFSDIQWEHNQVTCQLNERIALVVKRYNKDVYILLQSGTRCIKLTGDIFDRVCESQITIAYVKRCLENQEATLPWLCCYCGLRFESEKKCIRHEEQEHTQTPCFHANMMECDNCERSGPSFRASMIDFEQV